MKEEKIERFLKILKELWLENQDKSFIELVQYLIDDNNMKMSDKDLEREIKLKLYDKIIERKEVKNEI